MGRVFGDIADTFNRGEPAIWESGSDTAPRSAMLHCGNAESAVPDGLRTSVEQPPDGVN